MSKLVFRVLFVAIVVCGVLAQQLAQPQSPASLPACSSQSTQAQPLARSTSVSGQRGRTQPGGRWRPRVMPYPYPINPPVIPVTPDVPVSPDLPVSPDVPDVPDPSDVTVGYPVYRRYPGYRGVYGAASYPSADYSQPPTVIVRRGSPYLSRYGRYRVVRPVTVRMCPPLVFAMLICSVVLQSKVGLTAMMKAVLFAFALLILAVAATDTLSKVQPIKENAVEKLGDGDSGSGDDGGGMPNGTKEPDVQENRMTGEVGGLEGAGGGQHHHHDHHDHHGHHDHHHHDHHHHHHGHHHHH